MQQLYSWCRETIITWTSELEKYRPFFEEAVQECAKTWRGFNFYLLRENENYQDFMKTDSYIIKKYLRMDPERSRWVIEARSLASALSWEIQSMDLRRLTIVFTRQPIEETKNKDVCDTRSAVITLDFCKNDDELRKAIRIMLRHALGHISLGKKPTHCDNPNCIMREMNSRKAILQFPNLTEGRTGLCDKCESEIRKGRIWVDEPSFVSDEY